MRSRVFDEENSMYERIQAVRCILVGDISCKSNHQETEEHDDSKTDLRPKYDPPSSRKCAHTTPAGGAGFWCTGDHVSQQGREARIDGK